MEFFKGINKLDCGIEASGNEAGFTLIELLVIIGIIAVLAFLGLTSFKVYKAESAYASASSTLRNARTAVEASLSDINNPPNPVPLTAQAQQGDISDPLAAAYLPSFQLPRNIKFQVQYDPSCMVAACQAEFIQVNHCLGLEYMRWVRFGDGVDVTLEHLDGEGCP